MESTNPVKRKRLYNLILTIPGLDCVSGLSYLNKKKLISYLLLTAAGAN